MRRFALLAALGAFALGTAAPALADDDGKSDPNPAPNPGAKPDDTNPNNPNANPDARGAAARARSITFGDGVAKFDVTPDTSAGTLTFRLASDADVKLASAPTVTVRTDAGPKEVTLTPVSGQTNVWTLSHELVRTSALDGTMRIVVDGRTYTTPLVMTGWATSGAVVARHGGTVLSFADCAANVEVVQDVATGALMIYSPEDVQILEAPVITLTETKGPAAVKVEKVSGEVGVWRVVHPAFRTVKVDGRIRIMVNGRPCETALVLAPAGGAMHGGQIVTVAGGPRFEVVRDEKGLVTFYALDETIDGRAVVIERPEVLVTTSEGVRTYTLQPVPGQPRAWQLAGFEARAREPFDAKLRFTLFGKSLETNVGISGVGVGVR